MAQQHDNSYIEKPMTVATTEQGPQKRYRRLRFPSFNADVWAEKNPLLQKGELGHEKDTGRFKVGDGITYWLDLPYNSVGESAKINGYTVLELVAGKNIIFEQEDNVFTISAKGEDYIAGDGISIEGNVISNTRTNAEWGNITGDINNQTDLQDELNAKISTHNTATNAHSNIRGVAGGLATLDNNAKVPMAQINDALLGNVSYQGLWNASENVPFLADPSGDIQLPKGDYYITSVAGDRFGLHFDVGDWIISTGEGWTKVDNTDAVVAVNGMTGNVVLNANDVNAYNKTEIDDKFAEANAQINANTEAIADAKDDINDLQTQINTRTRVIIRRWN